VAAGTVAVRTHSKRDRHYQSCVCHSDLTRQSDLPNVCRTELYKNVVAAAGEAELILCFGHFELALIPEVVAR